MEATNRLSLSRFTPTCRAFWRSNRIVKTKELRLLASSHIARLFIDNRLVLQQDTEKSSDVGNTSVLQPILLFACTWYARKSLLRSIVESRLRWILPSRRNIENKFFALRSVDLLFMLLSCSSTYLPTIANALRFSTAATNKHPLLFRQITQLITRCSPSSPLPFNSLLLQYSSF